MVTFAYFNDMKIFFDQGCCPLTLNQDTTLDLPQIVPTFGLTHIYSSGEQNQGGGGGGGCGGDDGGGGDGGGTAGYDQSPDRELFKGLSRDRVLRRRVTWESGPARSSSIRIRATVVEVTGWRFTFPSWDPTNLSIRWETHQKRITAVSTTSTDRNTILLFVSNPTRRH